MPAGCATPTFTGTGADLDTIASHATRTAIAHLTGDQLPGGSVLYVATLRDPSGRPVPVSWRTRPIRRHRDCPMHHHRPAGDGRPTPQHRRRMATAPTDRTPDRSTRRRSEPAERDGSHLDNSTVETTTTRTGAPGLGWCSTRNRPDRR